ncbi:MAG: hypothetical protein ACYDDS_08925 [Candidatus Sulfotelmatobacter sp.]
MDSCRTAEEQAARWRAAGIPEGYRVWRLLYNAASKVLIAELRGMREGNLPGRLVMRSASSDKYEPIGSPDRDVSFESAATCDKEPILVFNSKTWQRSPEGHLSSANWGGLYVLNVRTGELNLCVCGENFIKPEPYDERAWISEVLGLSDDANHAYVKAALGKRFEESGNHVVRCDYHLARLNLKTREMELISQLKNLWF